MTRPAYSVRLLADRWQCSQSLIRKLISQGKLRAINLGQLVRISADEVDRYEGTEPQDQRLPAAEQRRATVPAEQAVSVTRYVVNQRWPDWPKAMTRRTAAAYLDLSETMFEREIVLGKLPASFLLGGREHWLRDALDAAIGILTGDVQGKLVT